MKSSTKGQLAGKIHEIKGEVKEKAREVAGSPRLESKGSAENGSGGIQKKVGEVEKVLGK